MRKELVDSGQWVVDSDKPELVVSGQWPVASEKPEVICKSPISNTKTRGSSHGASRTDHWPLATDHYSHGFTLVELLVVITIIGILIAMLVPGVMAMRESSRRMTCLHNLHQIGAALNEYTAAYRVLPPGTIDRRGPIHNSPTGNHMGWMARLLPYLDEKTVFDHVDFAAGAYAEKNASARSIRIPIFACPSDPPVDSAPKIAVSNYAGCHNDVEKPIDADNNGVLFLNSSISPDDVTDGVSHTIFVGEKVVEPGDLGWMSGTRATLRNTGTPPLRPDDIAAQPAPKSDLYVGGFSSYHAGVCNFLFGDERTDSISTSIDMKILRQLGNRADGELLKHGPTRDD